MGNFHNSIHRCGRRCGCQTCCFTAPFTWQFIVDFNRFKIRILHVCVGFIILHPAGISVSTSFKGLLRFLSTKFQLFSNLLVCSSCIGVIHNFVYLYDGVYMHSFTYSPSHLRLIRRLNGVECKQIVPDTLSALSEYGFIALLR